jgi:tetrahydromethanopterin S-methyltransferase subunit G
MIVLHPKYIDEIKSHPDMSFADAVKKVGQKPGRQIGID